TDLRTIIRMALELLPLDVVLARDGVQAVELLRAGERFSHVVTDVSMPNGISGIDVVAEVLRHDMQAKLVIASGYQRSQLPALPPQARFLPKPYRVRQLLQALELDEHGAALPA
ncbi:MAG: response regulator, partial [Lysobacteraceae bacterium]